MGFFTDEQLKALKTGIYICSKCGAQMEFEDEETEEVLICPACGHEVDIDRYSLEDDEAYEDWLSQWPTEEDYFGYEENDDPEENEPYDEVCGELDDYVITPNDD